MVTILNIIFGLLLGASIYRVIIISLAYRYTYGLGVNVFGSMLKSPIENYEFEHRISNFVTLLHGRNIIHLDLKTNIVNITSEGVTFKSTSLPEVLEIGMLYDRLVSAFNREIFVDVLVFNNIVYSNNIANTQSSVTEMYQKEPGMDMDVILDKIGSHGMSSLSKEEINFLDRMGN